MNDQERKLAMKLALELQDGPDKTQRSEEYWKGFFEKLHEFNKLVSPKEIIWLLRQYENERQIRDNGLDDGRGHNTRYLIEATTFERDVLYKEWSEKFSWEEDALQCTPTLAYIKGVPIAINMTWVTIAGERVCFWEPISELVDYPIIYNWLRFAFPNVPQDNPRFFTDAQGFSNMINEIKQKLDSERGLEKLRKT